MPADPRPHETEPATQASGVDAAAQHAPRDLRVRIAEQKLTIDWKDGRHSEYALDALRRVCPCATCRTEREQQGANPLRILKFNPTGVRVVNAHLVGNYAIQFEWSDGHKTGIFEFRFLRALSQNTP